MLLKNFELGSLFRSATVFVIYEIIESLLLCLKRKPYEGLAVFKGLLWNLINLKKTWKKRVVVQHLIRKVSDEEIKKIMLKPYPPFPLYIIPPKARFLKHKSKFIDTADFRYYNKKLKAQTKDGDV
jgi:Txe/YoeB family toxin of Txe-Axe toxin-antitoxin module